MTAAIAAKPSTERGGATDSRTANNMIRIAGTARRHTRLDGDFVAEAFGPTGRWMPSAVAFGGFGFAAVEELFAEFVVRDALVQDVVGGGEDLVGGGDGAFGVPAAAQHGLRRQTPDTHTPMQTIINFGKRHWARASRIN